MKKRCALLKIVLTFALCVLPFHALFAEENSARTITVIAEGSAALGEDRGRAEEEALRDAKRNAIEKAAGVFLKSKAIGRNFAQEEDLIVTQAKGFLKSWERLPGTDRIEKIGERGEILHLQISAEVALLPLLKRLEDIREAYDDLERPRIRVRIEGDTPQLAAKSALTRVLKAEGFEVSEGAAEVVFSGRIETRCTVHLGDANTPHGIGESIAAARSTLRLSIISEASEEALLTYGTEATASSFLSDSDAKNGAIEEAGNQFLQQNKESVIRSLLLHWATERQEGHVVALELRGLPPKTLDRVRQTLSEWRGFRRLLDDSTLKGVTTLRVLTLLSNREFRHRLTELKLDTITLAVADRRGSLILCKANVPEKRLPVRKSRTKSAIKQEAHR